MSVDRFKLTHWMNARKYTPAQVAERAGLPAAELAALLSGESDPTAGTLAALATALSLDVAQLTAGTERDLTVCLQTAEAMYASRRPIQRDGIHFYNYYTMAAPPGRVAPVILDILCPDGRLPALNNGHLEPAITVNLGPGDIHGRWGEDLEPATWSVLAAAPERPAGITGDSYVEPSHCPHAYSLASGRPARIVSYTGHSNLTPLVEELNTWAPPAFATMVAAIGERLDPGRVLDLLLDRRAHTRRSAAGAAGLSPAELDAALAAPLEHLDVLRRLAGALGFDYRVLLPSDPRHDRVGKTSMSVAESAASTRDFRGYRVSSMAGAAHLPDLTGMFLDLEGPDSEPGGELVATAETHYLVSGGSPTLHWVDAAGHPAQAKLGHDESAWVGPFVPHRWSGTGTVLGFGSGAHLGYLDLVELSNTYAPAHTLRRARHDVSGWGHEG